MCIYIYSPQNSKSEIEQESMIVSDSIWSIQFALEELPWSDNCGVKMMCWKFKARSKSGVTTADRYLEWLTSWFIAAKSWYAHSLPYVGMPYYGCISGSSVNLWMNWLDMREFTGGVKEARSLAVLIWPMSINEQGQHRMMHDLASSLHNFPTR